MPIPAPRPYLATILLRSYIDDPEGLAERIRACVEGHPTRSLRVEAVAVEADEASMGRTRRFAAQLGTAVASGLRVRSFVDGVLGGAYYVAVAVLPERVNALMDLAAGWALTDGGIPTADAFRPPPPIVAHAPDGPPSVDLFGRNVGEPGFGTLAALDEGHTAIGARLDALASYDIVREPGEDDATFRARFLAVRPGGLRVPVTAEPAPLGNWTERRGWEPNTPESELRTLHRAISLATRAFEAGDLAALGTVNPSIQCLVDAAVGYARRR